MTIKIPPPILRNIVALESTESDFTALFADAVDNAGQVHHYSRAHYANQLAALVTGLLELAALPGDATRH